MLTPRYGLFFLVQGDDDDVHGLFAVVVAVVVASDVVDRLAECDLQIGHQVVFERLLGVLQTVEHLLHSESQH